MFPSRLTTSRSICLRCVARCVTAGMGIDSSLTSPDEAIASSPQSMCGTKTERVAKHPPRHYRGRDNCRAAVHCSEDSRQLLELRHPRLAGHRPGLVRELLVAAGSADDGGAYRCCSGRAD